MSAAQPLFLSTLGRTINSGLARALALVGNVDDLFPAPAPAGGQAWVPLTDLLAAHWADLPGWILLVYELNGPIRFARPEQRALVRKAWTRWKTGLDEDDLAIRDMLDPRRARGRAVTLEQSFDALLLKAVGRPTLALETLRQLCLLSRSSVGGRPVLGARLLVVIEAADLMIPEGEITRLPVDDRQRVNICRDWFCDPGFTAGGDTVLLIAESVSRLHHRVARLPQLVRVDVPAPDEPTRAAFVRWFGGSTRPPAEAPPEAPAQAPPAAAAPPGPAPLEAEELARHTAGLSLHALRQLLVGARYEGRSPSLADVSDRVQGYVQQQLGEQTVEFLRPQHTLADVVGFGELKRFLRDSFIPRLRSTGGDTLPGAAVSGPLGAGKTFIFEAVAGQLGIPVLVLKNLRSKWFGETDVIVERLYRVVAALAKVLIVVDEADTQFGGVGADAHATERRLTGRIQSMMSDPRLVGRVHWLLMTARIHLLSPDIRRPGRVGNLIIPVLDPEGDDRKAFLRWTVAPVSAGDPGEQVLARLQEATTGYSAASFAALRAELKAAARLQGASELGAEAICAVAEDLLPPAIGPTRRYQTLQALLNCTRRSLLPSWARGADRAEWEAEIRALEARGIR